MPCSASAARPSVSRGRGVPSRPCRQKPLAPAAAASARRSLPPGAERWRPAITKRDGANASLGRRSGSTARAQPGDDVAGGAADDDSQPTVERRDDRAEGSSSSPSAQTTLASLDALLGTTPSLPADQPEADAEAPSSSSSSSSGGDGSLPSGPSSVPEGTPPEEAEAGLAVPRVSPRVSYLMLGVNLTVYGIGAGIALAGDPEGSNDFFLALACDHSAVASGEYYRLLTSTFMHAGLLHLGLNCAAILSVAPEAEAVLGYSTFAFIYLASGLSGSIASFLLTDSVTVGASGAIFGILGALIAYFGRNPQLEKARFQLIFLLIVAALNLGIGTEGGGLVDNSGHVAGLLAGGWLGFGMGPRWQAADDGQAAPGGTGKKGLEVVNVTPRAQVVTVALSFASSLPVLVAAGVAAQLANSGQ